ncbi:MAG: GNAT family N-acetyltransferase [Silicimonas sp.]
MPEYFGTDFQIEIQKQMIVRHEWLMHSTTMANGGRVMNILDPAAVGWGRVREFVDSDGTVALTAMQRADAEALLANVFGSDFDFPQWNVHISDANRVLENSGRILAEYRVPDGWRLECLQTPNDQELSAIQALNLATGVAPLPGPYLRGEVVPSFTACLWAHDGELAAVSNVTARYHERSRFGGHVFNGSTSVAPANRGSGLGKIVTAHVLVESQRMLSWTHALAQVAPDNMPSRRMVEACGLACDPSLVTFGVIPRGVSFTR